MTGEPGGEQRRAPRIAFVGWLLDEYGGMETRILAAARLAREAGFDVSVRTGRPTPAGSPTALAFAPFAPRSVIGDWQRSPRGRLSLAAARTSTRLRLRRPLSDLEQRRAGDGVARRAARGYWTRREGQAFLRHADVVHLFGPPHVFTVEALEAAHASGASTLYQSVHEVTAAYASIRTRFIGTCNLLDLILTSHPDQARGFAEHFGYTGPTELIQQWAYGIEAELLALPAADPEPGTLTVGALCRLDEVKGLDVLIDAVAEAARVAPGIRLRIGGTGDEHDHLVERARERGIQDQVELVGFVDDRPAFYRGVDVFAITSRAEGGPVTGVEAMAAGRAIVSTPVGAMPDRLDGGGGRLVPVGDAAATAQALVSLAADPGERAALGAAARTRYLARCSEAAQGALLVETWEQLAARAQR